jgi:general secretion pathway protein A
LHRISNGIPRLINLICDRALLGTYSQGKDRVDKNTLTKASREVSGKSVFQWISNKTLTWTVLTIVLVCLAVIAFVITSQHSEKITPSFLSAKENTQLSKLDWPENIPINNSKKMAYRALLKQWGIINKQDSNNSCELVEAHGLQCFNEHGSLDSLIQLNRPAILKLFDSQNHDFYVTLTSIHDQVATIVIGTETRLVDVKEIALHWLGEYIILWRVPKGYKDYIQYGSRGHLVNWLDEQLSLVQERQMQLTNDPIFDDKFVQWVKDFQIVRGLKPDGIVGPKTLIHLNSAIGKGDPILFGE